jgi:hypothetical protein
VASSGMCEAIGIRIGRLGAIGRTAEEDGAVTKLDGGGAAAKGDKAEPFLQMGSVWRLQHCERWLAKGTPNVVMSLVTWRMLTIDMLAATDSREATATMRRKCSARRV